MLIHSNLDGGAVSWPSVCILKDASSYSNLLEHDNFIEFSTISVFLRQIYKTIQHGHFSFLQA